MKNIKSTATYIAVILSAIFLGMIISLAATNIHLFSDDRDKTVVSLGKNPGIAGDWIFESDSDFRYLTFEKNGNFTFEQWTTSPYTIHTTFKGSWDQISEDTYRLCPDPIRPDIPALHRIYTHNRDTNGIYLLDTLTDEINRTYMRTTPENIYSKNDEKTDNRDILREKEEKALLSPGI